MGFKYKRKKKVTRKSMYSKEYIEQQRNQMYELLGKASNDKEADNIIKAFNVSMYPVRF